MKHLPLALLLASAFAFLTPAFAEAPALKAAEAAAIAQGDLASRGLEETIHIVEVNYKKGTLLTGPEYWEVLWNKEFPAQTEGRNEIGLRIAMDGTYKRAVR